MNKLKIQKEVTENFNMADPNVEFFININGIDIYMYGRVVGLKHLCKVLELDFEEQAEFVRKHILVDKQIFEFNRLPILPFEQAYLYLSLVVHPDIVLEYIRNDVSNLISAALSLHKGFSNRTI